MAHIYKLADAQISQPSMLTIGVFDGVHKGHQHLIHRVVDEARRAGCLAAVLTFFPHPDIVLRGLKGRYYLTTPEQRAAELEKLGVDLVITHPFNEDVRQMRAAAFVDELLHHLKLGALWVGSDFAMGYKREGNIDFLRTQGEQKGFTVHAIDLIMAEGTRVSSTAIREALQAGDMERAKEGLGRAYSLSGEVVHGKKRGRAIGYPTANIDVWDEQVIPANGVYAGWARLGDERFMAMTNVGVSPTFANKDVTVEAYLLDFDRDIYGQTLEISFDRYLRPEMKFNGLDGLIAQIGEDVRVGREWLMKVSPQP
jgi:riboflavin kinase / FMN adenylyltransferase